MLKVFANSTKKFFKSNHVAREIIWNSPQKMEYEAMEQFSPDSTQTASNRSVILEFQVVDVDKEYERLNGMDLEWVMYPANLPWGNRSIYFRDPDGNLINFYTRTDIE